MPNIGGQTGVDAQKENISDVNNGTENAPKTLSQDSKEKMEAAYTDKRTIHISLINSYSLFRKKNDKYMDERNEYIGSCIRSSRTLSANKEEVAAYFPNLIGLSVNDERFIMRVKEYLNNIKVRVDKLGKTLDITFHYYHYSDYLKIKDREEAIEEAFARASKQNNLELEKAIENKVVQLNALESEKHRYGYPEKIEDYLLYRHCLLYKDVAKDMGVVNSANKQYRFYFKDNQKEAELLRKKRLEINNAKRNYVTLIGDKNKFNDIYVQYCVLNNLPIVASLAEDDITKENQLDRFSTEEPVKFNKLFNDKDVEVKSLIEKLIAYGILVRPSYSQNILTPEGDYIGANIKEVVMWFKNPDNKNAVNGFTNKLKFV